MKIYEFFKKEFQNYNFEILLTDWEWDKKNDAIFYFLFYKKSLSKNAEIEGPPLKMKIHVNNFKKVHNKIFTKSGKVFALEQRKFLIPKDLLRNIAKHQFVKERCKSIKIEIL